MPIYEYRCGQCGHEMETIQKISDDPLEICPACNEPTLVKKISAAGFRLKGGGWYETDFKKGKKRNVLGSETSGASEGSGSSDSGSSDSGSSSSSGSDASSKAPSGSSSTKSSDAS